MGTQPPPPKWSGAPPQFSAHFYCGQTAVCIKMPLGMEVGLSPGDCGLDGDPAPLPKGSRRLVAEPSIFGPWLLWPNGWMDQDGTWHGGRRWSSPHCARWGHSSPPQNGGQSPQIFGPSLLWPNGWMHQDATWYGGRPRPTRHCVRCGPSYPTQFLVHVYCGQMAGWIKTPLGTEVDLGLGHIVLDGVSAPAKGAQQPQQPRFWAHVYCGHGRPSQLLLSSF